MACSLTCKHDTISYQVYHDDCSSSTERENSFESMIAEYVEIEDSIRKLWNELLDEQEHFVVSLIRLRYSSNISDLRALNLRRLWLMPKQRASISSRNNEKNGMMAQLDR